MCGIVLFHFQGCIVLLFGFFSDEFCTDQTKLVCSRIIRKRFSRLLLRISLDEWSRSALESCVRDYRTNRFENCIFCPTFWSCVLGISERHVDKKEQVGKAKWCGNLLKKKKINNLNIWCRLSRVVCTPLEVFSTSKSPVSTQILRGSLSMLWGSLKLLVPKELRNCERRDIKIPQMKQTHPNGRQ